jgi:WD40 repeat protein
VLYQALWSPVSTKTVPVSYFDNVDFAKFFGNTVLVSSAEGQTIELLDAVSGTEVQHFLTYPGKVLAAAMTRSGDRVAIVANVDGHGRLMEFFSDVADPSDQMQADVDVTGDARSQIWYDGTDLMKTVALPNGKQELWEGQEVDGLGGPRGQLLAISGDQNHGLLANGKIVKLIDLNDPEAAVVLPVSFEGGYFSISDHSERIVEISSSGHKLDSWKLDASTKSYVAEPSAGEPFTESGMDEPDAWSRSADEYAVVSDGAIDVFCFPGRYQCHHFSISGNILALSFSADGKTLRSVVHQDGQQGIKIVSFEIEPQRMDFNFDEADRRAYGPANAFISLYGNSATNTLGESVVENLTPLLAIDQSGVRWTVGPDVLSMAPYGTDQAVALLLEKSRSAGIVDSAARIAKPFALTDDDTSSIGSLPDGTIYTMGPKAIVEYDSSGTRLSTIPSTEYASASPYGPYVDIAGLWHGGEIVDLQTKKVVYRLWDEDADTSFVPGDWVKYSDRTGVRIFSLRGGDKTVITLPNDTDEVAVSDDGRYVATSQATAIVIMESASGKVTAKGAHGKAVEVGLVDRVNSIQFIPGTDELVTSATDGKVKLWDAVDGFVADLYSGAGIDNLSVGSNQLLASTEDWQIALMTLLPSDVKSRLELARQYVATHK